MRTHTYTKLRNCNYSAAKSFVLCAYCGSSATSPGREGGFTPRGAWACIIDNDTRIVLRALAPGWRARGSSGRVHRSGPWLRQYQRHRHEQHREPPDLRCVCTPASFMSMFLSPSSTVPLWMSSCTVLDVLQKGRMYTTKEAHVSKKFSTGNVVMLNSGGPKMTIVEVFDASDTARCVWFSGDSTLHSGVFMLCLLTKPLE